MEPLGGQQRGLVGGHRGGRGDDRRVGQDPARGDVAALGELVAGVPEGAYGGQRAAAADPVQLGGTAPRLGPDGRLEVEEVLELLARPLGLAGLLELAHHHLTQLDQHLDVEGGVLQPRLGQRAPGPVDRGVLLAQRLAERRLDQRGQPHPGVAQQPAGELGVEQRHGAQADLGQAGEVLGGGVQDPLHALERLGERGEVGERDRVDQRGAGALAAQLDEVGPGGVAVAGGALGVDGDRTGAGGEPLAHLGQGRRGVDDRGQAVAEGEQGSGLGDGVVVTGAGRVVLGGAGGVGHRVITAPAVRVGWASP